MGESSDCLQGVQLQKGRPDTRRSKHARLIEKQILKFLLNKEDAILEDRIDFLFIGLDYDVCKLVLGDFKRLEVSRFGVHISY